MVLVFVQILLIFLHHLFSSLSGLTVTVRVHLFTVLLLNILTTNSSPPSFHFFHHSDQSRLLVRNQSISFFLLINTFTEAIACSGYRQSGARPPFVCTEANIGSQFVQIWLKERMTSSVSGHQRTRTVTLISDIIQLNRAFYSDLIFRLHT
jgi:hypothetical protein